jgi:hypothetical protein
LKKYSWVNAQNLARASYFVVKEVPFLCCSCSWF